MRAHRHTCIVVVFCACGALCVDPIGVKGAGVGAHGGVAPTALVKRVVETAGTDHGLCAVVGCSEREFVLDLARCTRFLVHVLDPRAAGAAATRQAVDAAGLFGSRVVVETAASERLPHADNTLDVVVMLDSADPAIRRPAASEATRVLRPGGVLVRVSTAKGVRALSREVKPAQAGVDDWSHWEHGPDNNPVSTDAVIRAPYMTQFLEHPLYIAMPAITTAAGGRIFIAMGHIAHHVREEPWLNTLLARNGYNGTILWTRKLPDGYLAHRSAFVATDDAFYMVDSDSGGCLLLDPETGAEKERIRVPEHPGEWKWIALEDGKLFALVGERRDPPETTLVRSEHRAWSWGALSNGYYQRRVPWGFGRTILAYDLADKKVAWSHKVAAPVDSRAMVIGGGQVFFYAPDAKIGCLDARSGKPVWANEDAHTRELIEQPGRGLGSTPGFRTTCFCLYTPKALFYEAQTRMNIVAVSKDDGHLLWHRRKTTNNPNMLYVDGHLFVGIGRGGSTLELDPMTGKTIKDLKFAKRSCARLTATPDSLFCRGMPEGWTRYDRTTGKVLFNGAVRPACNDGVIGANGLLYIGPWLCDCNLSLMGRLALCSAGDFQFKGRVAEDERLEVGSDDVSKVAPIDVGDKDWPTYRGHLSRGASTSAAVSKNASKLWTASGLFNAPTVPTAAGGMLFVCDGDGRIRALDAASGKPKWTFLAGGPILQPPTIWSGRAYVGSGDGYVYALEAATGRMLWRFRAAPVERRIMVYGRLCSTWPVNSGVLVSDGVAYAAAGIIDYDGTYVCALDATTGKLKWLNDSTGHLDRQLRKGVSAQGVLTVCGNQLWMPGGNVIALANYELSSGRYAGIGPGNGSPRGNRGEEVGVFRGHCLINGGRLRYSARENVVNPGSFMAMSSKHDNRVKTLCGGKIAPAWNDDRMVFVSGRRSVPTCCHADQIEAWLGKEDAKMSPRPTWVAHALKGMDTVSLAIAGNAVLAVCEQPIPRTFRTHWEVFALDPKDGSVIWKRSLSGAALPGGLIVDREGRVIVVLADGSLECFGRKA